MPKVVSSNNETDPQTETTKEVLLATGLDRDLWDLGDSLNRIQKTIRAGITGGLMDFWAFLKACWLIIAHYGWKTGVWPAQGLMAMAVTETRDPMVLKVLIEVFGFSVNAINDQCFPPAYFAIISERPENLKVLIEYGADLKKTMAHISDNCNGMNFLMDLKKDLQRRLLAAADLTPRPPGQEHPARKNILFLAAQSGQLSWLKQLAKRGVDLNAVDNEGESLIHVALDNRFKREIVGWLIDQGININTQNQKGQTPLMYLASWHDDSQAEIACDLMKAGADPNLKDNDGDTALHYFCRCKNLNLVRVMLRYKRVRENVNTVNNDGETPLHRALSRRPGFPETIALSRLNRPDRTYEIVLALIRAGAKVNALNNKGETPLHYAAFLNYALPVQALLAAGARAKVVDKNGKTPLAQAVINRSPDTGKLLLPPGYYCPLRRKPAE